MEKYKKIFKLTIQKEGIADQYLKQIDTIINGFDKIAFDKTKLRDKLKSLFGSKYLGHGLTREVVQVSPNMVLKIPSSEYGIKDNIDEYKIYKHFRSEYGIFAKSKLITSVKGNKYLFAEKLTVIPERVFDNISNEMIDNPSHPQIMDKQVYKYFKKKVEKFIDQIGAKGLEQEFLLQIGIDSRGNLKLFDYSTL